MTNAYDYVEDAEAAEAPLSPETEIGENVVIGPLTDAEAEMGGLVGIKAFMRSKEAIRKKKQRDKRADERSERPLTVTVHDDDRETIRLAAARMIEDKAIRPALNAVLTNAEYCKLISAMSEAAELRQAIMSVLRQPKCAKVAHVLSLHPEMFASLRLMMQQPDIITLGKAAWAATGIRGALIRLLLPAE